MSGSAGEDNWRFCSNTDPLAGPLELVAADEVPALTAVAAAAGGVFGVISAADALANQ